MWLKHFDLLCILKIIMQKVLVAGIFCIKKRLHLQSKKPPTPKPPNPNLCQPQR
jgi:hypothetical protein